MRAWPLLLLATLAIPTALAQDVDPLAPAEDDRIESAALESTQAPVSPSLAGANGALLFGAMGAAFGAVIALGRYHKKRLRPIQLGVLREQK